ncbi:hypothetical protein CAP35_01765 [Chitinophagaceae bacterium IBVUCB1]|nr:hypothetical protein CAP35_01765 [Chitinophagaceae bacterium IBVUCB1]
MKQMLRKAVLALIASFTWLATANAQTNVEVFGQNRLQYRKFDWKFFDTKHFRIYHYDAAGRQLARYVAEQVENDIRVVERKMGGKFPHRFKIIVYNSYDEYRQTNIGRKYDSQLQDMPAGTVDLVGDKLVVYYTGVHTDLRRQTRAGMSRVIMERMLFGDNFREMVRNAVMMNLPNWTVYGFISYLVDGWDSKSNSDWKNLLESQPDAGFYELAEKQPELSGKAFWKYITDKYGEATTKNVLYTMQLKSNLNQGVRSTLGINIKQAYDSTIAYYKSIYAKDELVQEKPADDNILTQINVPKDGTVLRNILVAPRGTDVAYVTWKNGEYKVYLKKAAGEQVESMILQGGRLDYNEVPDPDYPIMAWSNNGYKLAILYKRGKNINLRIYNSYKAKIENYNIPANRFDRALGMTFNEDDDRIVFSAIKKSQTDLFEFIIRGAKLKNITNDAWDDVQPAFVSGGSRRGILFLSNRIKPNLDVPLQVNELPNGPMNVFFYNTKTKRKELLQLSHFKTGNATQPIQYGSDNYAFLYDSNGIQNQYIVEIKRTANNMDSAVAIPVTNHARNIINHQYIPAGNLVSDVLQVGDKYRVYYKPQLVPGKNAEAKQLQPTILKQTEQQKGSANVNSTNETGETTLLKGGNTFQSDFKEDEAAKIKRKKLSGIIDDSEAEINAMQAADSEYLKMKAQPYRLAFKPDFFTIRLDNNVLFNRYQSASQTGGQFINPPLGGLISVSLNDLMENYRITGGFRLPLNFSGTTYFLQYENAKRLVDWSLLYLRSATNNSYTVGYIDTVSRSVFVQEQIGKTVTNMLQGSASYPLDRIRSIRMHLAFRSDAFRFKAQELLSLTYDIAEKNQYWALSRVEYVHDNTIRPALNILNGSRYKIFAEYMYKMNNNTSGFYNIGTDIRHYTKIYKNFIWANRFAAATSGGGMKILYHIGGVDNWLNSEYSEYTPVRPAQNYGFEALANNLRGYEQNSRNGNSYALFNTELRLPVLTTFMKRPIQSNFLKNLQVVAFADIGSAWQGFLPTVEKLQNNRFLPGPNSPTTGQQVTLEIIDESGGVGLGYGAGLRTMVFGYFLRLDAAWNVENRTQTPLIHFSIGTDF